MSIAEKLTTVAENQQRVYDSGYAAGQQAGGGDNYHDTFWDTYQDNGNRKNYNDAFKGLYWGENFSPKYDIVPTKAKSLFQESYVADLVKVLSECGVKLDFSQCTDMTMAFYWGNSLTTVPTIDTTATTNDSNALYYLIASSNKVHTIEKVILKQSGEQVFDNTFNSKEIREIRFEGVIGRSLSFQMCASLSVESMKSVISHLKNYAGTENDGVYSVKFYSTCWNRLEADSTAPDGGTWKDYVRYTLGWAI